MVTTLVDARRPPAVFHDVEPRHVPEYRAEYRDQDRGVLVAIGLRPAPAALAGRRLLDPVYDLEHSMLSVVTTWPERFREIDAVEPRDLLDPRGRRYLAQRRAIRAAGRVASLKECLALASDLRFLSALAPSLVDGRRLPAYVAGVRSLALRRRDLSELNP